MKHILTTLLLGITCMLLSSVAAAQQVKSAIGVRLGLPYAVSAKYFFDENWAAEALLGVRPHIGNPYRSTSVAGAVLYHLPLELDDPDFRQLNVYFGGGAGLNIWRYDRDFPFRDSYDRTILGFRAYIGAQYAFSDLPLEVTIDTGPGLRFGNLFLNTFDYHFSTGIRYIIGRQ